MTRPLSIADALEQRLGRPATNRELNEEVKRILAENRDTINQQRSTTR